MKKKIALVLPSHFRRLPVHVGALYAWSRFLPKPDLVIGCSAGSIAGTSCLPWTEKNFMRVAESVKNLTTKQIYSILFSNELLMALAAAGSLLPLLELTEMFDKRKKILLPLVAAAILGIDALTLDQFLKRESLFSNEPLRQLLLKNLDFKSIFNSDIKLEIMATDIETSERIIFTNYLKGDVGNNERLVSGVLASSRLPGRFKPRKFDNKFLGDGAIMGNLPLDVIAKHNCDAVIMFLYTPLKETYDKPNTFIGDIIISSQITETELTRLQIENYFLKKRTGQQLPNLLVVQSDQLIKELNFRNFNKSDMIDSLNLGYNIIKEKQTQINDFIQNGTPYIPK